MEWLEQLKQHRLYRQHILAFKEMSSPSEEVSSPIKPEGSNIEKDVNLVEKDLMHLQGILDSLLPNKKDEERLKDFVVLAKEGRTS